MMRLLRLLLLLCVCGFAQASGQPIERDPATLQLASVSALAVDLGSGDILFRRHSDWQLPIASITKLMTALVILDADQSLDERLTIVEREHEISKNAYSRMRIGSQLSRRSLLRIMLMSSENLAAYVLSVHYPGGRDAFLLAMNEKARQLGMMDTRFSDASGLSPENVSTARDLAALVRAAHAHQEIREYSTTASYSARFSAPSYTLPYGNTNALISSGSWDIRLSKTGYLVEAGRCLVLVTAVDGMDVAMVLLDSFGTRSPLGDAARIRRWLATGDGGTVAAPALEYQQRRIGVVQQAGAGN